MKKINKRKICFGACFAVSLLAYILPLSIYAAGVEIPSVGLPQGGDLKTVVTNFMKWLLAIFGFLAIIAFIISGIIYITSAGDEDRQKTAKNAMNYSIIGVIVGLSGYVIIQAISSLLGGSSTF